MCGSKKSKPKPAPVLPEAPTLPDITDPNNTNSREKRRRAAAGKGKNSTILTSARGVTTGAATAGKTLLGA